MKKVPLLLVLGCLFFVANAQRNMQAPQLLKDKCQPHYLASLHKTKEKQTVAPIKQFEVADFRPDTSRMGFLTANRKWKEIRFRTGLRQELDAYLNNSYVSPGDTRSMLIIIKKCWVFDTVVSKPTPGLLKTADRGRIVFRAEAFLKTPAGYAPYAYLDTVVKSGGYAVDIANKKLYALLAVLMEKVSDVEEAAVLKRNHLYSWQALDSLNKRRFAYPMDTALQLRKGVYASVEEFRNNQPSILNYEVQKNKEGHLDLFLKDEAGQLYFSRKMWGYCDGEHCYAMMDGSLFPILPVDHAFYVLGAREYRLRQTSVPLLAVLPGSYLFAIEPVAESATRKLSIFQLDIHTGEID